MKGEETQQWSLPMQPSVLILPGGSDNRGEFSGPHPVTQPCGGLRPAVVIALRDIWLDSMSLQKDKSPAIAVVMAMMVTVDAGS